MSADLDDLLASARAGEGWAFDELFRRWNPRVTGFVRARGVQDVEVVVNDVFLNAFRALPSFEGDGDAFRSWLFRIARNRVIDEIRREARRPSTVELEPERDPVGGDVTLDADRAFSDDRVIALLAHLTDEQREVLALRFVADLTIDQIAAATGRRRGAIKQLQRRALRRLERLLDESPTDPYPS